MIVTDRAIAKRMTRSGLEKTSSAFPRQSAKIGCSNRALYSHSLHHPWSIIAASLAEEKGLILTSLSTLSKVTRTIETIVAVRPAHDATICISPPRSAPSPGGRAATFPLCASGNTVEPQRIAL